MAPAANRESPVAKLCRAPLMQPSMQAPWWSRRQRACDACEHAWEEFKSIKAAVTKKCPGCGKSKARRLISAGAGILFKGSGFYLTDYSRKGEAATEAKKEGATEPAAAKSDGTGGTSETTPAEPAKPAAKSAEVPAAPAKKAD